MSTTEKWLVSPQDFEIAELSLDSGKSLGPVNVHYETYGQLNAAGDNAILVVHALTGTAHAAGYHSEEDTKPGWWDEMIGPGKYIDTDKFFVVCTNCLGGCSGTTGPRSIDTNRGRRYNLDFPQITVGDQVEMQKHLMTFLKIDKWLAVVGGSMGGMITLEWAVRYPDLMHAVVPIATTWQLTSQSIAFNWVGRRAIMADPNWNNGDYEGVGPDAGLSIARMLAHITYLSDESMDLKFGRNIQDGHATGSFDTSFQVESYLNYQGARFVERFDANCYLYLTRMLDFYNLADHGEGSLNAAMAKAKCQFLVVSFTSDWLFPPSQSRELVRALEQCNATVTYSEVQSRYGHDAFLLEVETLGQMVAGFLENVQKSSLGGNA